MYKTVKYFFLFITFFCCSCFSTVYSSESKQNTLDELARLSAIIEKNKNIQNDTAFLYCKQAQKIALQLNDPVIINEFKLKEGELRRYKGDYAKAIELIESSITSAKQLKEKKTLANGYLILGKIQLDLSIIDAAYQSATLCQPLFQELNDARGEREAINLLGCILLTENKSEESILYFEKALQIDSIHKFYDFLAADMSNLGVAYAQLGKNEEAKAYYLKAVEISKAHNHMYFIISGLLNVSSLHSDIKDYIPALKYALEALDLSKNYEHKKQRVQSTYVIGYIYGKIGEKAKAVEYLTQTEDLSLKYGFLDLAKLSTTFLSELYFMDKNYYKAYYYKDLSSKYSDSLSIKQNVDNLNRLRYENKYIQEEKDRLWKSKLQNLFFWLIISILILVIVVFAFLFSRQKLKAKNVELEKLNLTNKLEHKSKEVITKIMFLRKKNEAISTIASNLLESKLTFKIENQPIINNVVNELRNACKDESWKEFELRFEEVHTDFFKNLNEKFPDLTSNEKRLCAYLRLNISTKDIASLLYLSVSGVESARYRLRKKLNINSTNVDVVQFLEQI